MNLQEKKITLEALVNTKLQELQRLEDTRNNLSAEVLELRGQIKLIDEMLKEEKPNEKIETSENASPKDKI